MTNQVLLDKAEERRQEAVKMIDELDRRGITRYEIAKKNKWSWNAVHWWETGEHKISAKHLARLKKFHKEAIRGLNRKKKKRAA